MHARAYMCAQTLGAVRRDVLDRAQAMQGQHKQPVLCPPASPFFFFLGSSKGTLACFLMNLVMSCSGGCCGDS